MECNRDEATRAKEIAERKFTARDVVGAKKFALKAQNLFPGLEGISQMISTLDVHLSGENKIGDEADWYGILGVSPTADDDTVRKKYRKLALMLHPDKNKSIGAEGAFKLISEAWSLLSDKTKRATYDQRRSLKTSQQKVPSASGVSSANPPGANGFQNFTTPSTNVKANKTTTKAAAAAAPAPAPAPPRHSKPNTFWTACHRCKMQYEYLRVYQNHKLLCPNCHEPFLAVETQAPPVNTPTAPGHWQPPKQRQNSNHNSNKSSGGSGRKSSSGAANMGSDPSNQSKWSPFSGTASGGSATASAAAAAQAASVVQQAYEKVKREREEAQAAGRRQEALRKKNSHGSKRTASNSGSGTHDMKAKRRRNGDENAGKQTTSGAGMASGSGIMRNFLEKDRANSSSTNSLPNSTRDLSQLELRNMLMEKARRQICKKLDECKSAAAGMATEKEKVKTEVIKDREKEREEVKETSSKLEVGVSDHSKGIESVDVKKLSNGSPSIDTDSVVSETGARNTMSITVPDPDFHDFDRDRSEKCFGTNQVWAAYDDDDGMPRYYAIIHKVISVNPFKMRISWLNSKTNTELGPLNWTGSGFSKTCGDFRVGKHEFNSSLNSFSHKVRWTKGPRGVVIIFPKKGDVWAVYRNWSPDWNELTPDEVIHKYDMVEVLEDYTEDQGVVVAPLVKVAGFKTVFHRHLNTREIRNIHREEMFRFSHQVPSCFLTGSEAPGAPKGCRELDPAATPVDLLQIVAEAKEEMVDSAEEETKAKHREVDVVEEEITVDTKEKMVHAGENEENVVEIVEEEMMMEAKEKTMIEDSKESDVMEIVDEEKMILEGEDCKTKDYNSSRNRMIRSLFEQEEDAVEEMIVEVKEKEIIDEEEEPMEEDFVENDEKQRARDDMEDITKETEEETAENVSGQFVKNNEKQKDTVTGEEVTIRA